MTILHELSECNTSNPLDVVYKFFRERSEDFGSVDIIKTPYHSKRSSKTESDNSYSFLQLKDESKEQCIERIFEIKIPPLDNKIDHRITTVHSSALAAMLCFHNISEENPLTVKLDGKDYTFTKFQPEYANECMKIGGDSKIDVALFNKENRVVFFMEAKFSEYLECKGGCFSPQYKEHLSVYLDTLPKILCYSEKNGCIKIQSNQRGKGRYREGIKQMICHHIGATDFLEKHPNYEKIFLGTLLFDFGKREELNDYSVMYEELAKNLNTLGDKIKLENKVFTYQDLFSYKYNKDILPEKVKKFYNL